MLKVTVIQLLDENRIEKVLSQAGFSDFRISGRVPETVLKKHGL
jgi:hypothetical protein